MRVESPKKQLLKHRPCEASIPQGKINSEKPLSGLRLFFFFLVKLLLLLWNLHRWSLKAFTCFEWDQKWEKLLPRLFFFFLTEGVTMKPLVSLDRPLLCVFGSVNISMKKACRASSPGLEGACAVKIRKTLLESNEGHESLTPLVRRSAVNT